MATDELEGLEYHGVLGGSQQDAVIRLFQFGGRTARVVGA